MKLESAFAFYGANSYPITGIPETYIDEDHVINSLMHVMTFTSKPEYTRTIRESIPGFCPRALCFQGDGWVITYI